MAHHWFTNFKNKKPHPPIRSLKTLFTPRGWQPEFEFHWFVGACVCVWSWPVCAHLCVVWMRGSSGWWVEVKLWVGEHVVKVLFCFLGACFVGFYLCFVSLHVLSQGFVCALFVCVVFCLHVLFCLCVFVRVISCIKMFACFVVLYVLPHNFNLCVPFSLHNKNITSMFCPHTSLICTPRSSSPPDLLFPRPISLKKNDLYLPFLPRKNIDLLPPFWPQCSGTKEYWPTSSMRG